MTDLATNRVTAIGVLLTWHEVALAAHIGVQRQVAALAKGLADRHGLTDDPWNVHIEGACGEMAGAKAMGVYWTPTVNTFRVGGDIGGIQVRTRSRSEYELLIRPDDCDTDIFVLVTGRAPRFTVHGWLVAADAKRDEWLQEHGGRAPAWFVPQHELRDLAELRVDA